MLVEGRWVMDLGKDAVEGVQQRLGAEHVDGSCRRSGLHVEVGLDSGRGQGWKREVQVDSVPVFWTQSG